MVFRITYSKGSLAGAVLLDMMIGVSISSLIILVLITTSFHSGRTFAAMRNCVELENESRVALDTITQDIRSSKGVQSYSKTSVTILDQETVPISFEYDPDERTLSRVKGGVGKVLLSGCDKVQWEIFQRTPIAGTGEVYPATTAATAKLVQVTWITSRDILGKKLNSETVQSAKITIRGK